MKRVGTEYIGPADIQEMTGYSAIKSSRIIQSLNRELATAGCMTILGRIPREYFLLRYGLKNDVMNAAADAAAKKRKERIFHEGQGAGDVPEHSVS